MNTQAYLNKRPSLTLVNVERKADVLPSALWALTRLTYQRDRVKADTLLSAFEGLSDR